MPSPSRFENRQWQGFRLGSGPGLAGDSKPGRKKKRGGGGGGRSVKAGEWLSQLAICWWLTGGQLSKAGGRGGCLVLTPPVS